MNLRYPCGTFNRRAFLAASAASVPVISSFSLARASGDEAQARVASGVAHVGAPANLTTKLGTPGLYPGRVVEVKNPAMIRNRVRNQAAIKASLEKGLTTLTGAPEAVDAWKTFFEPGDVVGIKVVPNGQPFAHSAFELVLEVIEG